MRFRLQNCYSNAYDVRENVIELTRLLNHFIWFKNIKLKFNAQMVTFKCYL